MGDRGVWVACRAAAAGIVCVLALGPAGCGSETDRMGSPVLPGQSGTVAPPIAGGGGTLAPPAGASGAGGMVGVGMAGASGTPGAAGMGAGAGGTAGDGMAGAETGGIGGSAGEPAAGAGGGDPTPHEDLGEGDGQDVITIGDSWMNLILTGIEQSLATASGRTYRNFAVPGTLVLNEQIPGMYESAKSADPDIKTVVMTGGGNDILSSPCTGDACAPIVDDVAARLTELQAEMAADGVQDVVIIGYTYPADMGKHASLDYSIMLSEMTCLPTNMPRCHFIDSTMLDITLSDGIHPNAAGYDLLGETVWALMQAEGMRR
jgi:lysophospholipase L1-like esterase